MFEVLVYMFENYIEADIRPDQRTLARELFAAGFDQEDINGAFDWFSALEEMTSHVETGSHGVSEPRSIVSHGTPYASNGDWARLMRLPN